MRDFYAKLLATSAAADIHVISDENCCKLLAWLYAYGGAYEAVIFNARLNEDIKHAQLRLNIEGSQTPNKVLFSILHKYLQEVRGFLESKKEYAHPEWALEIFKKYNIKPPFIPVYE